MAAHNEWEGFFDQHASFYRDEPFTCNTEYEIEFLAEELGLAPGATVLDLGCGIGRHAVPLAQRGCRVTGVDLSQGLLAQGPAAGSRLGQGSAAGSRSG